MPGPVDVDSKKDRNVVVRETLFEIEKVPSNSPSCSVSNAAPSKTSDQQ